MTAYSNVYKLGTLLLVVSTLFIGRLQAEQTVDSLIKKADVFHKLGLKYDEGDPMVAIANYDRALQLRKKISEKTGGEKTDVFEGIVKGYFNIGDCWGRLGDYHKMNLYYDSCLHVQQEFEEANLFASPFRRGQLHKGFGNLFYATADYQRALDEYRNAHYYFGRARQIDDKRHTLNQAMVQIDIAQLLIKWEMHPDSILHYSQAALAVLPALLSEEYKPSLVLHAMYSATNNQSYGYEMKGDLKRAEQSYQQALEILNLKHPDIDLKQLKRNSEELIQYIHNYDLGEDLSSIYNGLGLVQLKAEKFLAARKTIERVVLMNAGLLALYPESVRTAVWLSGSYNNLTLVSLAQGNYAQALEETQRAIDATIYQENSEHDSYDNPKLDAPDLLIYSDIQFLKTLLTKVHCLFALKQNEASVATINTGIDYLYQIRNNYLDFNSQFQLAILMKEMTEQIIAFYLNRPEPNIEQAFYYAEKHKNYTLLEAVKNYGSLEVAGIDPALLERERDLRKKITQLTQAASKEGSGMSRTELLDSLQQTKTTLAEVLSQLSNNPNYQKLFLGVEPISIADIQSDLLADDQALVEYFVGKETTYVFVIAPGAAPAFYQVPQGDASLNHQVGLLLDGLLYSYSDDCAQHKGYQAQWTRAGLEQQFFTSSQQLYQDFFAPVFQFTQAERLVVIPDGALNRLPFSILLQPANQVQVGDYHAYPYLGKEHTLSYCYAATLLSEMQKPGRAKTDRVLAFAPSFAGSHPNATIQLPPLRFNGREAQNVCNTFDSSLAAIVGPSANKKAFLEMIEENPYYILHLATHAQADNADPNNSFISFTQPRKEELDKSQLFYLRELYNLMLDIETVVLSSCETNLGPVHRAGGMVSLTRGFTFAGARSIVSSLWAVDEVATNELMKGFYKNLKSGMPKDQALQAAKMDVKQNGSYQHPYYWAAFIPLGKVQELSTGPHPLLIWTLGSGAFLLLLFVYFRKK